MRTTVTEKIRQYRILKGFSQQNLADELDLTIAGYSKIERGETELTISRLSQIAGILDIDISELVSDKEEVLNEPRADYGIELSIAVVKLNNDLSYLKEEVHQLKKEISELKIGKTKD